MKNEIVSLSLSTDSIIAIIGIVVTVLIPVIGGIYKIVTSTKKYELTENYRKELLVYFYNTALKSVDDSNVSVLWKQERNFTALMFDVIEPRKRNRDYSKHLGLTIPKGQAIEDFIYENPKNINVFRS